MLISEKEIRFEPKELNVSRIVWAYEGRILEMKKFFNSLNYRSIYMMLIHESHKFELRFETRFEVCGPRSHFNATYVVTRKT